ncbi:MAG: MFS transporter [Alphaproteobacteria bacterium]|nr:MFS transporter [Alphaproteobacteria bacterium]
MTLQEQTAAATPSIALDSRYSWFRLAVSLAAATVSGVGMWAVILVIPSVQEEFGVDRSAASLSYTSTMLGFALGNFAFGRMIDRFGITPALIVAVLMIGSGFALAAATSAMWQFALVQGVLIGAGTSIGFGPLIADTSLWFNRRRGIAVALVAAGNYAAGAIWPLIIKSTLQTDGWRTTYFIIAIACTAIIIPLALVLRRRSPIRTKAGRDSLAASQPPLKPISLSPRALQLILVVAGVACCVAMSMPQVHIVAYCGDLGYGPVAGAEMLSLMLAGGIASRLTSGFLADYIGGLRTVLLGAVLQGVALLLYLPFDGLASLYVVSLIFGLSQGGIVPSYAIVVRDHMDAREAGQRVGLVMMSTVVGMAFGGWLSGFIFDHTGSYQAAFLNGIAWNLLNVSIMTTLLWRSRRPRFA